MEHECGESCVENFAVFPPAAEARLGRPGRASDRLTLR